MTNEQATAELEHILELESIALGRPTTSRRGYAVRMALEVLKQPEQKKGRWIVTGMFDDFLKCSCCGYKKPWNQDIFNFCPHCGAKMEVKQ